MKEREERPIASVDMMAIDTMVKALYDAVSFRVGEEPDWHRLRSLFAPNAQLIHARTEGTVVLTIEGFIAGYQQNLQTTDLGSKGFFESEIARQVQQFGNIAHIFSTFESRHNQQDTVLLARGINSIQLVKHHHQWRVMTILWDDERNDNFIPPQYLP